MRISDWSSDVCSSDLAVHDFEVDSGEGDGAEVLVGSDLGSQVVGELDEPAGALRGVGDLDRLDVDAETVDVELGRGDQPPKVGGGVDERRQVQGHHVHPAVVGLLYGKRVVYGKY